MHNQVFTQFLTYLEERDGYTMAERAEIRAAFRSELQAGLQVF